MQTRQEVATAAIAILRGQLRSGMLRDKHLTQKMVRETIAAWDGIAAVEPIQAGSECVIERARRGHA